MDIPLLAGVILETMQMYPMIPGPLERYFGKDLSIAGHMVPKGVIASTAALSQGQLADVYPQSHKWLPEHWIDANERMKLNWIPFGTGCRSCLGANTLRQTIAERFHREKSQNNPPYTCAYSYANTRLLRIVPNGTMWLNCSDQ